jgi:hypothetical protein
LTVSTPAARIAALLSALPSLCALAACAGGVPTAPAEHSTPPRAATGATTAPATAPTGAAARAATALAGPATPETPLPRGGCGTVSATSGLTLRVLRGEAGTDCPTAERIVERFQRRIAGRQPRTSHEPIGDSVDGWWCVSGPPAAQGGSTCSKDDQTVLAAVVPTE